MERRLRVVALVSVVLSACGPERSATEVEASGALAQATAGAECQAARGPQLEVMTRNLYLGADILAVTQATTPEAVVAATTAFWAQVQATDFPARAKVLADEVFWARPEVLGLQEVATYRSGAPLVCIGAASPSEPVAAKVELDFLALLQKELRGRGLHYELAGRVTTTDVELCALDPDPANPAGVRDLRYTDHDVLLVRGDVKWRSPTLPVPASALPGDANGARFTAASTAYFDVIGARIYAWRGWTATEVRAGNRWVRVFETHLEDWLALPPQYPQWLFQAMQAAELVSILDGALAMAPLPSLLLGDCNAYVTLEDQPPVYQFLTGGAFPLDPSLDGISPLRDAWTALRPHDPGFSWGFDEWLRTGALTTRLDLVLATDGLTPLSTWRVGTQDRTRSGLHPSDHAGLVTVFAAR